jgi:hypothetical protein
MVWFTNLWPIRRKVLYIGILISKRADCCYIFTPPFRFQSRKYFKQFCS